MGQFRCTFLLPHLGVQGGSDTAIETAGARQILPGYEGEVPANG